MALKHWKILREMHKFFLAFGTLTRSPEQGRDGVVYNGENFVSSFLDELDHLEQFKHVFQKSDYLRWIGHTPRPPSWKIPPKVQGIINETVPN